MNRLVTAIGILAATTGLLAQEPPLTNEQKAEICAAEGGCVTITRKMLQALMTQAATSAVEAVAKKAYEEGAKSCAKSI